MKNFVFTKRTVEGSISVTMPAKNWRKARAIEASSGMKLEGVKIKKIR